ncbi:hypothetical protein ACJMK2_011044, partial [Sinanodonta woodiana]
RVNAETVWLQDVTTGLQTDKRLISDLDLPDVLTFAFSRGSQALNLNLRRNHDINPNADIYIVEKLKDGRFHSRKSRDLGQANGNIRIQGSNYDLRPAETIVTLRNFFDIPNHRGIKYVLKEQGKVQCKHPVEQDEAHINRNIVGKEYIDQIERPRRGQDKQNHFLRQDATLSSHNIADFHERTKDEVRNLKKNYYIEVGVLVDSGLWDLHYSLEQMSDDDEDEKELKVKSNIREYFCHIINGVNLLYKNIQSPKMSITVTLLEFFIYKLERDFPYNASLVLRDSGYTFIDAIDYLKDVRQWDVDYSEFLAPYDHAMLFTGHDLYTGEIQNNSIIGRSFTGHVCDIGRRTSIVQAGDYFRTVSTAAHELGHNLGAVHDGEETAVDCPAEDKYIMSPKYPEFQTDTYSRNPWLFSKCSVKDMKRTLKRKTCVSNIGGIYDKEEWTKNVMRLPGEVYDPSQQCKLIKGPNSDFCGVFSDNICLFMKCKDPKTGNCLQQRFVAARGTKCGRNK